jgi:phage terminase large subunit
VYWSDKIQKWTAKGEIYVNKILKEGLSGLLYKRLYQGLWVLAEGQVYDTFDHSIHVIPRFEPPGNWHHYWCFDFGYIDPFVWQEWVEDPETGALYLYRELYHSQIRVEEACNIIKDAGWKKAPVALICDHDAENRATLEKEFNMLTLPAFKLIHPGIQAFQRRLKEDKRTKQPGVFIMENANIRTDRKLVERHQPLCTVEEFDNYVWDTGKISIDKYKDMPVDKYNHGMDACRYMTAFIDSIAEDPQEFTEYASAHDLFEDDDDFQHMLQTMISPF